MLGMHAAAVRHALLVWQLHVWHLALAFVLGRHPRRVTWSRGVSAAARLSTALSTGSISWTNVSAAAAAMKLAAPGDMAPSRAEASSEAVAAWAAPTVASDPSRRAFPMSWAQ